MCYLLMVWIVQLIIMTKAVFSKVHPKVVMTAYVFLLCSDQMKHIFKINSEKSTHFHQSYLEDAFLWQHGMVLLIRIVTYDMQNMVTLTTISLECGSTPFFSLNNVQSCIKLIEPIESIIEHRQVVSKLPGITKKNENTCIFLMTSRKITLLPQLAATLSRKIGEHTTY